MGTAGPSDIGLATENELFSFFHSPFSQCATTGRLPLGRLALLELLFFSRYRKACRASSSSDVPAEAGDLPNCIHQRLYGDFVAVVSNEGKLQAIQMAWYEEYKENH